MLNKVVKKLTESIKVSGNENWFSYIAINDCDNPLGFVPRSQESHSDKSSQMASHGTLDCFHLYAISCTKEC